MTTTTPTIGTYLREARLSAGLTQAQLSDRTGLDRAIISNAETDKQIFPAVLDAYISTLDMDRDATYHAAGRIASEITAALAHDLPLVREIRERLGL